MPFRCRCISLGRVSASNGEFPNGAAPSVQRGIPLWCLGYYTAQASKREFPYSAWAEHHAIQERRALIYEDSAARCIRHLAEIFCLLDQMLLNEAWRAGVNLLLSKPNGLALQGF